MFHNGYFVISKMVIVYFAKDNTYPPPFKFYLTFYIFYGDNSAQLSKILRNFVTNQAIRKGK